MASGMNVLDVLEESGKIELVDLAELLLGKLWIKECTREETGDDGNGEGMVEIRE